MKKEFKSFLYNTAIVSFVLMAIFTFSGIASDEANAVVCIILSIGFLAAAKGLYVAEKHLHCKRHYHSSVRLEKHIANVQAA